MARYSDAPSAKKRGQPKMRFVGEQRARGNGGGAEVIYPTLPGLAGTIWARSRKSGGEAD